MRRDQAICRGLVTACACPVINDRAQTAESSLHTAVQLCTFSGDVDSAKAGLACMPAEVSQHGAVIQISF